MNACIGVDGSVRDTETMNVDQLVAHIRTAVFNHGTDLFFFAKPRFEATFVMGEHFLSIKDAVVARLTADGYKCSETREFFTCPITGTFPVLRVEKVQLSPDDIAAVAKADSPEERARREQEFEADLIDLESSE